MSKRKVKIKKEIIYDEPFEERPSKFATGLCFYKLFWIFLFGCVFRAYWEEIISLLQHYNASHELVWQLRRGVIYGPISPIYGIGTLIIVLILGRKDRAEWKTLLYGAILGGSFEYFMSFFQEVFFHTVSWDYSNELLNINGRTTIPFALVWGLLALALVKFIYPIISNIVEGIPYRFGLYLTRLLILLVSLDFALSWGAIIRKEFRHNGVLPITFIGEFFDNYYPDEVLNKYSNNMVLIEARR